MSTFTPKEKERIFVERTQDLWPANWNFYLELIKHETWSRDQLAEYNFSQRIKILTYAYEHSIFYKRLYDEIGLKPQDIKTEDDWNAVPIVTKQMIADYSDQIQVTEDVDKYGFVANTGGSTGKPLKVYRDKRHFWMAPFWRFYGWHVGRKSGSPFAEVPIFGLDHAYLDRSQYRFTKNELKKRDESFWPIKYFYLSPYSEFSDQVCDYVKQLSASPLVSMYAYAGAVDTFADYCMENNVKIPHLAFIEVCASPVTEVVRAKVKEALNCHVFDFYGSNEMGPMAVECSHGGQDHHLHVLSDLLHIDLVNQNGLPVNGKEVGNTVVTCFTNRVFPFVKYDHGDRTHWVMKPCDCGLPFQCIAPVKGRMSDYLVTNSGEHVDGVGFNEIFDFNPEAVKQFQFRQSRNGFVELAVVPNHAYNKSHVELEQVFHKLQSDWNGRIEFTLSLVDEIPHEGGKQRYIVRN